MHKIRSGIKLKELPCGEEKSQFSHDAFDLKFYNHISDAKEIWDEVAPKSSALLSSRYMQMMERYAPKGIQMRYIIVFRAGKAIGIIPCALKRFEAKDSIQLDENEKKDSWLKRSSRFLRFLVVEKVSFNTLICGNIFFTGEYAFHFNEDHLDYVQQFNIVEKALMDYQYHLLDEGMKLNVSFMKDFYVEKGFENQNIESSAFNEFKVQPSMHLDLKDTWETFDHYLADFHSKARVRARKAFKKGEAFEKRILNVDEVVELEDEMFSLYKSVSQKAGFNLFELRKDYFTGMRKELGACMKIKAYFLEGKLVGFFTGILDSSELIAHFLGYDKSLIRSHDIYLNILFDLVKMGIEEKCEFVNFGRTAMEIKSSVGAVPHDMFCYIKHRKHINNLFVPRLVKYLNPQEEWRMRSPFKKIPAITS